MVALFKALSSIEPKLILVVGDLIVDRYIFGRSKRISPEAPVPIVLVDHEETRAGGAGNVALNLVSMGTRPRVVGRVGDDAAGRQLIASLEQEGVDASGIFEEKGFSTPAKTRVIASAQQLVRVDYESCSPLTAACERMILAALPSLFEGVQLVAISDYAKGTLSDALLRAVIDAARSRSIPCITDPKGTNFRKYAGSTIVKPNVSETISAAPQGTSSLEEAAAAILRDLDVGCLMVTRSEEGISLFYPDGRHDQFPVPVKKEVRDVTGAGDTVLAMLSAAYASGLSMEQSIALSNVAASCAVDRVGCARVSLQDIASQLIAQNPSGKVCSSESFFGLLAAMPREQLLMVRIPCTKTLSSQQLLQLSDISSVHPGRRVIACFEEEVIDPRLLKLVASLEQTHLVVHGLDTKAAAITGDHLIVDL